MQEDFSKRQDPRDKLERRRRFELLTYAKKHNITDIVESMPAKLMRNRLRRLGINDLDFPMREPILGTNMGGRAGGGGNIPTENMKVETVDALSDLERQWQAQQRQAKPKTVLRDDLRIWDLRRMCKERGIKIKRTDKMVHLRELLNG